MREMSDTTILPEISEQPIRPEALKCRHDINDYNRVTESIQRTLEFLQLYLTELTLDATVGTRALQGSLPSFFSLKKWKSYQFFIHRSTSVDT